MSREETGSDQASRAVAEELGSPARRPVPQPTSDGTAPEAPEGATASEGKAQRSDGAQLPAPTASATTDGTTVTPPAEGVTTSPPEAGGAVGEEGTSSSGSEGRRRASSSGAVRAAASARGLSAAATGGAATAVTRRTMRRGASGAAGAAGETPPGKPTKPLLAAAALVGAVLIAIPLAIAGAAGGNAGGPDDGKAPAGLGSDTRLSENGIAPPVGAYAPASPSPSASASPKKGAVPPHKPAPANPEDARPPAAGTEAVPVPRVTSRPTATAKAKAAPSASPKPSPSKAASRPAPQAAPQPATPSAYRLRGVGSGKCLSADSGKPGTQVTIRPCSTSSAQKWTFEKDGTLRSMGLCLDLTNGSTHYPTKIQVTRCNGSVFQQFRYTSADTVRAVARTNSVIDVWNSKTVSGTPVVLWGYGATNNQKWSVIR